MDTTEQAQLQQALKTRDLKAVRSLVESPVPLSVGTTLKRALNSTWNKQPELGAKLINATARELPEKARVSIMRELASEEYLALIEQSLDREWCPRLTSELAEVLADATRNSFKTLTKYVREQGPAHAVLGCDILRPPQHAAQNGLLDLYRVLFDRLPLDTVGPRVADSRNNRALKALIEAFGSSRVKKLFQSHTFPSSVPKAVNSQAFYERMSTNWTGRMISVRDCLKRLTPVTMTVLFVRSTRSRVTEYSIRSA